MITYNHERFIRRALASVIMQEANFDYELVIGEDCSTDQTRQIVLEFQKEHPDRIRLLDTPVKLGMNMNVIRTFNECRAEYVALIDGDDYWTSPYKLQKQVDFLDGHPECSTCFHPVQVVFVDQKRRPQLYPARLEKDFYTLEDILNRNFMGTCSVMFRRGLIKQLPDWFTSGKILDWPLHILNAEHGGIGLIREVMGVYRVHGGGVWWSTNPIQRAQESIKTLDRINVQLGFRHDRCVQGAKSEWHFRLALEWARCGHLKEAREYARVCTADYWRYRKLPASFLIVVWLCVIFPRLYRIILSKKVLVSMAQRALIGYDPVG